ncbi:MAG: hypothetical protein KIH64_014810 [Mycobacterium sp.]|nr:hypothetical protein [Mycobacterium sp.]
MSKLLPLLIITLALGRCGAVAADACAVVPDLPVPTSTVHVNSFGAIPDDAGDDTAAIERALRALQSGQRLTLGPGRYLLGRSVFVRTAGAQIVGEGARIHATNPDSQALIVQADGVWITGLRFTAVTDGRRTAPWHSRIAVYLETSGVVQPVRGVRIVGNTIAPDGAAPAAERAAGSAGGIMLLRAVDFVVAANTVARTLADGIHITAGSRDGRVVGNIVRENGDDMIAVVSYAGRGPAALNTADMLGDLVARRRAQLVQNVLIAGNDVQGQYWGRGITVVGGRDITIRGNRIDNTPLGAGILVAREHNYETFGVSNVLVAGNAISRVQTDRSPFDPDGTFGTRGRTGHGAIEVHASLFADEAADADLRPELAVRDVAFISNTISGAAIPGARLGVPFAGHEEAQGPAGPVRRAVVTGDISGVTMGPSTAVTGARLPCMD